jgi:hypothetical protein
MFLEDFLTHAISTLPDSVPDFGIKLLAGSGGAADRFQLEIASLSIRYLQG